MNAHDGPPTDNPGWIGSRWKNFEPATVLPFDVALDPLVISTIYM
jgi:hypothetical protein